MTFQYLFTIVLFALLTTATVAWSLLPWSREHHLRAWQEYRFNGARTCMDGELQESESFCRGALMEAKMLGDAQKIDESQRELANVQRKREEQSVPEKASSSQSSLDEVIVWPSSLDYLRVVRRNRMVEKWEPALKMLVRREKVAAKSDPRRMMELGDALMEMARFEPSKGLYLAANEAAKAEDGSTSLLAETLDRQARARFSLREFGACSSLLDQAIGAAKSNVSPDLRNALLLHQAQTLCEWGEYLDKAKGNCDLALASAPPGKGNPLITWYARLLSAQVECRKLELAQKRSGNVNQSIALPASTLNALKENAAFASNNFGTWSMEAQRSWEALAEALMGAGKKEEARLSFTKFIEIKSHRSDEDPICSREVGKEAKCYLQINNAAISVPLWEWAFELKSKETPNDYTRLSALVVHISEAYQALGDETKASEFRSRAIALGAKGNSAGDE